MTPALARNRLRQMRRRAFREPWDGRVMPRPDLIWHTSALTEAGRPTTVMLTFDHGAHACGWWRNSDYDRCLHLSFTHQGLAGPEAPSVEEAQAWARAAFGEFVKWTWTEPAASSLDPYRLPNVVHVRLFLSRQNRPILPEGEVYDLKPWDDGTSPEKVFR